MVNIARNIAGAKTPQEKKLSVFMRFMKWIEKGRENEVQCIS